MNKRFINILIITMLLICLPMNSLAGIGIEDRVRSYLIGDYETGEILKSYNKDEVVEIASITKIMTYMVVMDKVKEGRISLRDRVVMDQDSLSVGGSSLEFELGGNYSVDELLTASLMASANNATYRLAKHVGGNEDVFANMMNTKAKEIGLNNAVFYNSTGLPIKHLEDQNKMKVTEVFEMARYAIRHYPDILDRTRLPVIPFSDGGYIRNTNPILNEVDGVDGLKTGFTNKAGYCNVSTLVKTGYDEEGEEDIRLIGIVMGSENEKARKETSKILMDYGKDYYAKKRLLDEETPLKSIDDIRVKNRVIETYPKIGYKKIVNSEDNIGVELDYINEISLPIEEGSVVGEAIITEDGRRIFRTDIIVKEDVKKANVFILIFRSIGMLISKAFGLLMGKL